MHPEASSDLVTVAQPSSALPTTIGWRMRSSGWAGRLGIGLISLALAVLMMAPATAVRAGWAAAGQLPSGAGTLWSLAVDPASPQVLLAGADDGVFRSTDSGATWTRAALKGTRVWTVGFDPRTPHLAVLGTSGSGIQTSTDGGITWLDASAGLSTTTKVAKDIRSLAFSLSGVAAGTGDGVVFSADSKSWRSVGLNGLSIDTLTVAANAPSLVLLAGTDTGDVSKGALFQSNGDSWTTLGTTNGLPANCTVSSLASGPPTAANPKRALLVTTSKGTFRSVDGGQNWTASQGIPTPSASQSPIVLTTSAFSPVDPSVVYAGADAGGSTGGDLLRSTDGGLNFAAFDGGLPAASKNVVGVAVIATQTGPQLFAGLDPPGGQAQVFGILDSSAPPPPSLLAEVPGAQPPTAVASAPPQSSGGSQGGGTASPTPAASGISQAAGTILHWPTPLVYELLGLVLAAYVVVRWRQRSYVEGPPD